MFNYINLQFILKYYLLKIQDLKILILSLNFTFIDFFSNLFIEIISTLITIIGLLIAVAFYTLAERKVMGAVQRRQGPHTVGSAELGISGLLQPVGDGLKLIMKEMIMPSRANIQLFFLAPLILLILSFTIWAVIPFNSVSISFYSDMSLLVVFAISSLSIYGVILAGWASNSTYAFLGALRSTAQMISYEIAIGFVLIGIALWSKSLNLVEIVLQQDIIYNIWALWPLAIIMFVSALAETNRVPFDLVEAEAEIVAGYNVEYSCILFAMFFLAEYSFMLLMSAVMVIFFFGGWLPMFSFLAFIPSHIWFSFKIGVVAFLFILVRAALPRVRYDQLMNLGWKIFLPLSLGYIIFLASIVYVWNGLTNQFDLYDKIDFDEVLALSLSDGRLSLTPDICYKYFGWSTYAIEPEYTLFQGPLELEQLRSFSNICLNFDYGSAILNNKEVFLKYESAQFYFKGFLVDADLSVVE